VCRRFSHLPVDSHCRVHRLMLEQTHNSLQLYNTFNWLRCYRSSVTSFFLPMSGLHCKHVVCLPCNLDTAMLNKKDGYRQRNVRQFLQSTYGTFWPPWVRPCPWDNRGKCHMDETEYSMLVKCTAACTHLSSTVSQ